MKAAYLEQTGAASVIRYGDLPTPEPKPGEVRVKVAVAALNPIDVYIRSGQVKVDLPMPFITGTDLAGTVEATGVGVKRFQVGDRVWGSNQGLLGRQGTFAEFSCVAEDYLYPLPNGVAEQDAAAIALVGITAHIGLFIRANLKTGETVFVDVERPRQALHHRKLVLRVEDLELARQAGFLVVRAQQPVGEAVKGADPKAARIHRQHRGEARDHLACRLVGEGHREHAAGSDAAGLDQPGDACREDTGLAAAGAREHERMPVGQCDRVELFGV